MNHYALTAPRIIATSLFGLLALVFSSCAADDQPDAYGNFEATTTTISAQTAGRLLALTVDEGDVLSVDENVGLVDTTQLAFQRDALVAQRRNLLAQRTSFLAQEQSTLSQGGAASAQIAEAEAQAGVVTSQLRTAREELGRTERLFAESAATARELNQRQGEVATLEQQLRQAHARIESVRRQADATQTLAGVPGAQAAGTSEQAISLDAQIRQVEAYLADAAIMNPTAGSVLTTIARVGELVQPGSPLYTIAPLDTLTLRAYVTGEQLPRIRLGMPVEVLTDDGDGGIDSRNGTVKWIAASAEFTPNQIQTRDERADLVYAFEVRVPNQDGALKIGMPGEVRFHETTENR